MRKYIQPMCSSIDDIFVVTIHTEDEILCIHYNWDQNIDIICIRYSIWKTKL